MAKTITVTLPDGYEDTTHLVAVVSPHAGRKPGFAMAVPEYAVHVLEIAEDGTVSEAEEVGCNSALGPLMDDAARLIRTGSVVV